MSAIDPEIPPQTPQPDGPPPSFASEAFPPPDTASLSPIERVLRWRHWAYTGDSRLGAGWSVLIFALMIVIFLSVLQTALVRLNLIPQKSNFSVTTTLLEELFSVLAMLAAVVPILLIERRRILDFNLTGPRRVPRFLSGLVAGFAGISALVGVLTLGGWMHFGPVALSGAAIFKFGVAWAAVFLLAGLFEEGTFRCYLQFTLTRGINFWWAIAAIAAMCAWLVFAGKGNGVWGVYAAALLGFFPCLWLHFKKPPTAGFWQAAWVSSTLFGFVHTSNGGEDPVGIFGAALIGFVFCVSIRVTGSAWWAIGCHAAWDWGETYFYGAIDSGNVATTHFLTTTPAGNTLWSGGTAGPEGSLLTIAVVLLLMAALLVLYGRRTKPALQQPTTEPAAG